MGPYRGEVNELEQIEVNSEDWTDEEEDDYDRTLPLKCPKCP